MRMVARALQILLLCATVSTPAHAQAQAGTENWPPVPAADLALADNPKSPGAPAMILYREHAVDETKGTLREYKRIKIFKEEGRKIGNIQIEYDKDAEEIRDIRARTIQPDGSAVPFTGQILETVVAKARGLQWHAKTFVLPNVQPGTIVECEFQSVAKQGYTPDRTWMVQLELYTREAKFTLRPKFPGLMGWRAYAFQYPVRPEKLSDGSYLLMVHELPGIEKEEFMPPEELVLAHIHFFYRALFEPQGKTTGEYWAFWSKQLDRTVSEFLGKKKLLEGEASRLVTASDSPQAKLQKIYARTSLIQNTSFDREKSEQQRKRDKSKPNENVEDLLKHGSGSGLDINALFIGLARAAGLDANLVMVAGRDRNKFRPDFQDYRELSENLVEVKLPDGEVFLDPGARFYPYGLLPWWETEASGIRGSANAAEFVKTPQPRDSEALRTRRAVLNLDAQGSLAGTVEAEFAGRRAATLRTLERDEDEAGKKKRITDEFKSWLPASADVEIVNMAGWNNINVPLHAEATLRIPGYASAAGRRLLTPLTPFRETLTDTFAGTRRVSDVFFDYPLAEADDILLRVPEGYEIKPPAPTESVDTDLASYSVTAVAENTTLHVRRNFALKKYRYSELLYNTLRDFLRGARDGDEAQALIEPKK